MYMYIYTNSSKCAHIYTLIGAKSCQWYTLKVVNVHVENRNTPTVYVHYTYTKSSQCTHVYTLTVLENSRWYTLKVVNVHIKSMITLICFVHMYIHWQQTMHTYIYTNSMGWLRLVGSLNW